MDVNLQSRKIAFVRAFLNLENEHSIDLLEKVLEKEMIDSPDFSPMTIDELNSRIDRSLEDSKADNVTEHSQLKKEMANWK